MKMRALSVGVYLVIAASSLSCSVEDKRENADPGQEQVVEQVIDTLSKETENKRMKTTMLLLKTLGMVFEMHAIDHNVYPGPTEGFVPVSRFSSVLEPLYIKSLPVVDGWGNALRVYSTETSYVLVSVGRDGHPDRVLEEYITAAGGGGLTDSPDADIVYSNSGFYQYPFELPE